MRYEFDALTFQSLAVTECTTSLVVTVCTTSLAVTVCTTSLNIKKFYILPTQYLYLLYMSRENHRSFPYPTLNDRLL